MSNTDNMLGGTGAAKVAMPARPAQKLIDQIHRMGEHQNTMTAHLREVADELYGPQPEESSDPPSPLNTVGDLLSELEHAQRQTQMQIARLTST